MQLVNGGKSKEITTLLSEISPKMATGGSASNTINGITRLGAAAGLLKNWKRMRLANFSGTIITQQWSCASFVVQRNTFGAMYSVGFD